MFDVWLLGMGYLGLPLAHALSAQGKRLLASSRSALSIDLPFSYQPFDIDSIGCVEDFPMFCQAKTWVCLLPPSCSVQYESFLSLYKQAALKLGVEHIVYASSISVYGDKKRDCFAHSPSDAQTQSAKTMVRVEQQLLASDIAHITVLRLAGLFSDDRHPIRRLSEKGQVNGALQCVNMIAKADAVATLLQCCLHPNGHRIINAVMAEHPSKETFYTQAAQALSLPVPQFIHDTQDANNIGKCVHAGEYVIQKRK